MAFRNPPISGSYLVRPAIQSPNYVAGSAGWTVNRDGSAEFNVGVFRGSLNSGNPSGQHLILNNGATGDAVDVYDSSDRLVASIDATGTLLTINQPAQDTLLMQGDAIAFYNQGSAPSSRAGITGTSSATGSQVIIDSGRGTSSNDSILWLLDSLLSPDGKSYVRSQQKATHTQGPISGSVMQTDTDNSSNNCVHVATYSITTDASGNSTFNHGCRFTPAGGFLASTSVGGADFYEYVWLSATPFTATQASAHFNDRLGNSKTSTSFTAIGIFIG